MGHLRLGRLPRTRKWKEVIGLVDGGGSAAEVADATIDAAEDQLEGADPAVVHAVWLLTRLPDAARSADFGGALRDLGIAVSAQPSPAELAAALGRAVDDHLYAEGHTRSDVGEMARLAAVEVVAGAAQARQAELFGPPERGPVVYDMFSRLAAPRDDAQAAIGQLATAKQFGVFARDFFARLTERVLTYYVSKELPLHVGPGQRFGNVDEQRAFQDAVALHARQAARIVEEFAGGWWSKARYEQDLSPERTARFVAYAMKKMRGELRRGAS